MFQTSHGVELPVDLTGRLLPTRPGGFAMAVRLILEDHIVYPPIVDIIRVNDRIMGNARSSCLMFCPFCSGLCLLVLMLLLSGCDLELLKD
jgi:hypothetical protein